MARRKKKGLEQQDSELNLAPIMNLVMILIPLLLLSTEFMMAGVVNISSPRDAQSTQEETEEREEEEEVVPRVMVAISGNGFYIMNQRGEIPAFEQYAEPVDRCAVDDDEEEGARGAPTICLLPDVDPSARLVERLDYAALYNRLAQIRLHPDWYDRFGEDNNDVLLVLGDNEIPFDALLKTMDTARYFLQPQDGEMGSPEGFRELPNPSASVDVSQFMLGDGGQPTLRHLEEAQFLVGEVEDEEGPQRFSLFPNPVLQVPNPASDS